MYRRSYTGQLATSIFRATCCAKYRTPLRVFELKSKTRIALPSQKLREKSASATCYMVFDFSHNIVALKIDVASCPVKHRLIGSKFKVEISVAANIDLS